MDIIVVFFRDVLDGPLYIIVALISGILFCSCIGYLAEQNNLKKAAKEKFTNSYATVANIDNSVTDAQTTQTTTQPNVLNAPVNASNVVPQNIQVTPPPVVNNGQSGNNLPS